MHFVKGKEAEKKIDMKTKKAKFINKPINYKIHFNVEDKQLHNQQ